MLESHRLTLETVHFQPLNTKRFLPCADARCRSTDSNITIQQGLFLALPEFPNIARGADGEILNAFVRHAGYMLLLHSPATVVRVIFESVSDASSLKWSDVLCDSIKD